MLPPSAPPPGRPPTRLAASHPQAPRVANLLCALALSFACPAADERGEGAPATADDGWFAFHPPAGTAAGAAWDLRFLNEKVAGERGRIVARDGRFVHATTGEPVRFWAVNGPPRGLDDEALRECARDLAARGVNLVRVHGAVFDEKTGELKPDRVTHLTTVVAAMKDQGIYTHLSIYFPLWMKPAADLDWLEGYDGNRHPFAALMFNEAFRRRYEGWWRAVLDARLPDGTPLRDDPALFGVEIQNEDSFFFWTFAERNLPEPQWRILEKQFGDWLAVKHGSLARAFAAWGSTPHPRDREAEGRAGFRGLWEIFNQKTARDRDTTAFLLETQTGFYRGAIAFLRQLGFRGLVTCSNWATASPEVFGPLEKLSYTVGDFIDRHGYFGCRHAGPNSEWSIRDGHTYADRSALRFDAEKPGAPREFRHPVMDIEYNGLPSMISETTWTRPNRHRGEAPLFLAAYGALQETDAIVHFALDGADWSVKPGFFMQPWTLMAPTQAGQFPAAALLYRRGLVRPGELLADIKLKTADLRELAGTPLPQDAAFDELRLRDIPTQSGSGSGTGPAPGRRIDPLIHFAGRTRVDFGDTASVRVADLAPLIDHTARRVRSSTGELDLDYGRGVLRIDAPAAQGASGDLKSAGPLPLQDVVIDVPLDVAHVLLVALDGRTLRESRRLLLQVMSEERTTGWKTEPQGNDLRILSIGRNPWQIRKLAGRVRLLRPDAGRLTVRLLDATGRPFLSTLGASEIHLAPDVLHYLVESPD